MRLKELVKKYSKKRDFEKFNNIIDKVNKRKMINILPSNIKTKERNKLIENEFLIKDKKDLWISGGGRIALFLFSNIEMKRIIQFRNFESFEEIAYLIRKLNYFDLKVEDFNKDKLLY